MGDSKLNLSSISNAFTEEILKLAVQRALNGRTDVTIKSHEVNFGTEKGDGYMGIVYRITVHLSDGSDLSLIGKGLPPNIVRRKTFNCASFFAKEVDFFNKYAPILRKFEIKQRGQEKVTSDTFMPIAECYYAMSDGVNDFLVFQDLRTLNYGMTDRINGPSEVERTALMHSLARFHALSLALQVVEPETFEVIKKIEEPWFRMDQAPRYAGYMHKMYMLWYRAIKDGLKGTETLKRFEEFGPDPTTLFKNITSGVQMVEPSVLAHGDAWSTNFLFKGDQVMLIDFQIVRYCSAMSDISIYVFSCTTEEQRQAAGGMDAILRDYYKVVTEAVKELGVAETPLTLEKMMDQWRINGLNGLACALELVPLSLVESEDVQDLDRMTGDEPIDLVSLTQFKDITDPEGRKRLIDLTKLAVDYKMI